MNTKIKEDLRWIVIACLAAAVAAAIITVGTKAFAQPRLPICNDSRLPLSYYNQLCTDRKPPAPARAELNARENMMNALAVLILAQNRCHIKITPEAEKALSVIARLSTDTEKLSAAIKAVQQHDTIGTAKFCSVVRENFGEMLQ